MTEKNSSKNAVLELELDLHKAEYLALRDEILHTLETERQALNLSIVAVGAGISVISIVDQQSVYIIILLFPFIFHVLIWEMLNTKGYRFSLSLNLSGGGVVPTRHHLYDKIPPPRE